MNSRGPISEAETPPNFREWKPGRFPTSVLPAKYPCSVRVREGLARRRAKGLLVGRMKGAKDKGRRRGTGYLMLYTQ